MNPYRALAERRSEIGFGPSFTAAERADQAKAALFWALTELVTDITDMLKDDDS